MALLTCWEDCQARNEDGLLKDLGTRQLNVIVTATIHFAIASGRFEDGKEKEGVMMQALDKS